VAGCGAGCPAPDEGGPDLGATLDAVLPALIVGLDLAGAELADRASEAETSAECVPLIVGSGAAYVARDILGSLAAGQPRLPSVSIPTAGCGAVDGDPPPAQRIVDRAFGAMRALYLAYSDRLPCEAAAWIAVTLTWAEGAVGVAVGWVSATAAGEVIPSVSLPSREPDLSRCEAAE
jgi:hypothetical protein